MLPIALASLATRTRSTKKASHGQGIRRTRRYAPSSLSHRYSRSHSRRCSRGMFPISAAADNRRTRGELQPFGAVRLLRVDVTIDERHGGSTNFGMTIFPDGADRGLLV